MEQQLRTLVDEVLRPLITADGGVIELVSVDEHEVVLELGEACAGCPGMYYTRGHVIEPAVRSVVGNAVRVEVRPRPPRPKATK